MNILVVCQYGLYEDLSYSFVHNQIREYAALGHRVRALIPNGVGKKGRSGERVGKALLISKVDGVELFDLRYVTLSKYGEKKFNTASAESAIALNWNRIFGDFQPDVIHAHTLGFDSEIGAWLKTKFGCPLVVTTHGSDTNVPLNNGRGAFLKACCDEADVVVAVSEGLRKRLATCGTTTKLLAIHNGFKASDIPAGNIRKKWSMIQVCNLIALKRVDVTIRAFAKIRERYPQMTLTIVGSGPMGQALRLLAEELGVSDAVQFLGRLPNHEVLKQLCQSEIFVMVSKPEGLGIAYLEAMASGCVTIGTEGEGIADIIVDGENGFLVPADDPEAIVEAVCRSLENPEAAEVMASKAICDVKTLTWDTNAKNYLNLFAEILAAE